MIQHLTLGPLIQPGTWHEPQADTEAPGFPDKNLWELCCVRSGNPAQTGHTSLSPVYFKWQCTVNIWKYHQWDNYTWVKEGLGQSRGTCPLSHPMPFTRHCSISVVRALSKVALCPKYLSPPSGTMVNPHLSSMRTPSPRTCELTNSMVSPLVWDGLHLPSCPCQPCPSVNTAFKPEPHCPPVNHLAHPTHPNTMYWWQLATFST